MSINLKKPDNHMLGNYKMYERCKIKGYDSVGTLYPGCDTITARLDGKWFHIDSNYNPIYEERYDLVGIFEGYDTAIAMINDEWFHIGKDGKPLYKERYHTVKNFGGFDTAIAMINDEWFHIDINGSPLYEERYDDLGPFQNDDSAWVKKDNKEFHIDRDGKPLYKERYDSVFPFNEREITQVVFNGGRIYITKDGKRIEPIEVIDEIGSRFDKLSIFKIGTRIEFHTGCFAGSLEKFKAAVIDEHNEGSHHYIQYMEVIRRYEGE
jgi:hypothetical protein